MVGQGPSLREAPSLGIRCFRFLCSCLAMPAAPDIHKALHPKTAIFLIATSFFSLNPYCFKISRGYNSLGTGRDLPARGLYL